MTLARNGVNVIALADGAGSAKLSHYGAEQVVNCLAGYLADNFLGLVENEDALQVTRQILETARNGLEGLAAELECRTGDLASTFLAVAVLEDRFLIVHVGDGVIGYLKGGELKVASGPDNGEFANVTTFVTSGEALASMRLIKGEAKDLAGFVLMSDGTQASLYDKVMNSLVRRMTTLMHWTCLLSADIMKERLLAAFDSVIIKQTQDDCSLALLARPIGLLSGGYTDLDALEKCEVMGLPPLAANINKRLAWFDEAVDFLKTPRDLKSIAKHMRLKPNYTETRLQKLKARGLVAQREGVYFLANR